MSEQNPAPTPKFIDLKGSSKNPLLNSLASFVSRVSCIDDFNRKYELALAEKTDENFFDLALRVTGINYVISAQDREKIPCEGTVIVVSNHPHGLADGIAMGSLLVSARDDVKFIANQMLSRIPQLDPYFFHVNPFGGTKAAKSNVAPLMETIKFLKKGGCLGTFPSGTVSHIHPLKRKISDPRWNLNIATIARLTKATILPVFIEGRNSNLFQCAGLIHPRLRTALLLHEFAKLEGHTFEIRVGQPIPASRLEKFSSDAETIEYLRLKTYILGDGAKPPKVRRFIKMPRLIRSRARQEQIAAPTPPEILEKEIKALPPDKLLIDHGGMQVYISYSDIIPNVMNEIGRLREKTFRAVGEGTGKALDIDGYDAYYMHLFIWNDKTKEIVGGYRLGRTDRILSRYGPKGIYTASLFRFKEQLLERLSPALEMGRSFIREEYQRKPNALPLLWRGIGEFIARHPQYRVLFGPVSISSDYKPLSRDLMVQYLKTNTMDADLHGYVRARRPPHAGDMRHIDRKSFRITVKDIEDISELVSDIETDRKGVPVLLRHYLRLNATILSFNVDKDFCNVIDGLIVVDLMRTDPKILRRFMGDEAMSKFFLRHTNSAENE